ncbi:hypothetical protein GIB67_038659 [Kingdonia uniflora]|uniref:Uncharacterized protein n=1 Tax=Kingdonia uniflora TaxID=39325 RepID=A0A7J7NQB6_9MAGN|nr:hypothetical protein GIB67_038659 [Kingdonia uniflora]
MQIFISYGKKSNGELLLSYGFVPKEGTNTSDSADLSVSLNKTDVCYKEKLEVLRKHGLSAIFKYTKFLQGSGSIDLDVTSPSQINQKLFLKQLAVDLCTSEQRILFRTQYILRRRLRDMKSGELRGLSIFNGFFRFFK